MYYYYPLVLVAPSGSQLFKVVLILDPHGVLSQFQRAEGIDHDSQLSGLFGADAFFNRARVKFRAGYLPGAA